MAHTSRTSFQSAATGLAVAGRRNDARSFDHIPGSNPPALIPLLLRSLDFTRDSSTTFSIVLLDGETVAARASLSGSARMTTIGGDVDAERITVTYSCAIPSPIVEIYPDLKHVTTRP